MQLSRFIHSQIHNTYNSPPIPSLSQRITSQGRRLSKKLQKDGNNIYPPITQFKKPFILIKTHKIGPTTLLYKIYTTIHMLQSQLHHQ
jgi:hypothetical protein